MHMRKRSCALCAAGVTAHVTQGLTSYQHKGTFEAPLNPDCGVQPMEKNGIQLRSQQQLQPQQNTQSIASASALLPDEATLTTIERLSDYVIESGEYAKRFRNKAQAVMVMLRGHNLGISFDSAIDHVFVVHGKTGISGQLMLRLIYERVPGAIVEFDDSVDRSKKCVVKMGRPGHKPQQFSFSIEEADAAGITRNRDGSPNMVWKAYREDMLRWRAVSRGARIVFPDAIQGCWLQSELAEIKTHEDSPDEVEVPRVVSVDVDHVYTRDELTEVLKSFNRATGNRWSYHMARQELLGIKKDKGDPLTADEINRLCHTILGYLDNRDGGNHE